VIPLGVIAAARTAPGGGGSSHRYWRWINIAVDGGYLEISELRVVNGSTPIAATVSGSTPPDFGTLASLVDGSYGSQMYWAAATVEDPGFWIMADLGSAQTVTGTQVSAYDTSNRYPTDITLQYADSETGPWTTFGTWSGLTYPGNNTAGLVLPP
jgi:hypothetical protein